MQAAANPELGLAGSGASPEPGEPALSPFVARHIGPSEVELQTMLADLGVADLEQFVAQVVPADILLAPGLAAEGLPEGCGEAQALADLAALAAANQVRRSLIGLGYYGTATPAVIQRQVFENPSWYTAYTPTRPRSPRGAWRRSSISRP